MTMHGQRHHQPPAPRPQASRAGWLILVIGLVVVGLAVLLAVIFWSDTGTPDPSTSTEPTPSSAPTKSEEPDREVSARAKLPENPCELIPGEILEDDIPNPGFTPNKSRTARSTKVECKVEPYVGDLPSLTFQVERPNTSSKEEEARSTRRFISHCEQMNDDIRADENVTPFPKREDTRKMCGTIEIQPAEEITSVRVQAVDGIDLISLHYTLPPAFIGIEEAYIRSTQDFVDELVEKLRG